MAKLTDEQIERIQKSASEGASFTSIVNTRYHVCVKVNTEAVVMTSMLADDNEKSIIINLADVRTAFDSARNEPGKKDDPSGSKTPNSETTA